VSTALSAPPQMPTSEPQLSAEDWKQQLAARLEAYRAKMGEDAPPPLESPSSKVATPGSRASSIARAVASRYAAQPTYSEILEMAAAAERLAQEQEAALQRSLAEKAAQERSRRQEECILREQAQRNGSMDPAAPRAPGEVSPHGQSGSLAAANDETFLPLFTQSMAEEMHEKNAPAMERNRPAHVQQQCTDRYEGPLRTQSGKAVMPQFAERSREMRLHQTPREPEPTLEELLASSVVEPRAMLPSKLIEFPRELVSTHRSRPRLPDVPRPEVPKIDAGQKDAPRPDRQHTEEARIGVAQETEAPDASQLRIFEVQPENELQTGSPSRQEGQTAQPGETAPHTADVETGKDDTNISLSGQTSQSVSRRPKQPDRVDRPSVASATPKSQSAGHAASSPGVRAFQGLEWAAISLDKEPVASRRRQLESSSDSLPFLAEPASIDRRLMAFAVDFAAVTAGFLGFLVVFAASTPHLPQGMAAVGLAGAVYAALWVLYQVLFFSFSGATAGMLYARIALCTFDDQNPTRSALRRRLAAWWLSCLPMGMGFLWSFVDEDNLCWHDRMTRMYQRTY